MSSENTEPAAAGSQWVMLVDPTWKPQSTEEGTEIPGPPVEAVVGGWLARADGSIGHFVTNPVYKPATPNSPTDPLDAVLQLTSRQEVNFEQLASTFREALFQVPADHDNNPVITSAPDGVPCLLATTAPAHRTRVSAEVWLTVTAQELPALLDGKDGVDVLINPGAAASVRLLAGTVRTIVADGVAASEPDA